MKIPKRKGIILEQQHVSGAKYIRPVEVGETSTWRNLLRRATKEEIASGKVRGFGHGKIYLNGKLFEKGKMGAQRVFLKPVVSLFPDSAFNPENEAKLQAYLFNRLREIGLPSPRACAVQIEGQWFVAVQPYLREANRKSGLIPINTRLGSPTPFFLQRLTIEQDAKTIVEMAKHTAKLLNEGYYPDLFDFFGLYKKKDGQYGIVLMDVSHLEFKHPTIKKPPQSMANEIRQVWAGFFTKYKYRKEYALFKETLLSLIRNKEVRNDLIKGFKGKVERYSMTDFID